MLLQAIKHKSGFFEKEPNMVETERESGFFEKEPNMVETERESGFFEKGFL